MKQTSLPTNIAAHGKVRNVLVYPGGTEIGLEIARSLKPCKEVRLVSAGLGESPADFFFSVHYEVQTVSNCEWRDQIKAVIEAEQISHILPAHDDVIIPLLENEKHFSAKIVTSKLDTCRIARSKRKTVAYLSGVVPVPKCFDCAESVVNFPVFLKPDSGCGSRGALIARNPDQLKLAIKNDPSLVIQEYLPGEEYTIDCFSDREKGVLYARGRSRSKITNGIASRSFFACDPVFENYAKKIHEVLPFQGAWFFQLKKSANGDLALMEVAPRIAGTSGLSRVSGVNLPLLSLYESDCVKVTIPDIIKEILVERTLTPVYSHKLDFDALYLDYDDTVIVNGAVNSEVIKVAYQCINLNKPVYLVTRHKGDIMASLRRYRLYTIFDKVVQIETNESKRNAIEHASVVFVDDSFHELEDLRLNPAIIPIHVSSVEFLVKYNGI